MSDTQHGSKRRKACPNCNGVETSRLRRTELDRLFRKELKFFCHACNKKFWVPPNK